MKRFFRRFSRRSRYLDAMVADYIRRMDSDVDRALERAYVTGALDENSSDEQVAAWWKAYMSSARRIVVLRDWTAAWGLDEQRASIIRSHREAMDAITPEDLLARLKATPEATS